MNPVKKILGDNSKDKKLGKLDVISYPNQYNIYDINTGKSIHPDVEFAKNFKGTEEQLKSALQKRWKQREKQHEIFYGTKLY